MTTHFFLGANSGQGFQNLFPRFCKPEDHYDLIVLKGGPGVGKSTMMRRIGKAMEDRGEDVEYLYCSGDPNSLDGVHATLSGPPASREASLIMFNAKMDVLIAAGWGLNTTVFPAAIIPKELQITVSLGLVVGVIAPITPKGPISIRVSPLSPDHAVVFKSSVPGVLSATR